MLARLGLVDVFGWSAERYPRLELAQVQAAGADLVLLPDEPYVFTADDGPEAFPDVRTGLISGRQLTWYGPSLATARTDLLRQVRGDDATSGTEKERLTTSEYTAHERVHRDPVSRNGTRLRGPELSAGGRRIGPVPTSRVLRRRPARPGAREFPRRGLPRARPNTQDELLEWLRRRPVTTIHALRQNRFTLRMIAVAEREGLVLVDFAAGTVAVR